MAISIGEHGVSLDIKSLCDLKKFSPVRRWDLEHVEDVNFVYPARTLTKAMAALFPQTADFQTRRRLTLPSILRRVNDDF